MHGQLSCCDFIGSVSIASLLNRIAVSLAQRCQMSKYKKAQLEEFFYRQYEYIESLNDRIQLLQEQNVIYRALNKKLTEEQLNKSPEKIYPKPKRKK